MQRHRRLRSQSIDGSINQSADCIYTPQGASRGRNGDIAGPLPPPRLACSAVKKVQPVLGGFDASKYATERLWATAPDGTQASLSN